ncbi:GAF and ANTAR domain-containing protein [Angustibacter luteus]|uniref:GAF and ANTAR domain-containing protein n=1 Tax=Angustibacter luteus TaxID=658456 RepID=A0ABW1JBN7_9ACTN
MSAKPQDAHAFAKVSQQLLAGDDPQAVLRAVVDLAVHTIGPCDYAGISLRHGGGLVDTPAMTDPIVGEADSLQYQLGQGPCLDALSLAESYVIQDLHVEDRWPRWAPGAAALGLRSVLSVRLQTADRVVGGLNLYSAKPYAFTEDDVVTGHIYAIHASTAIRQTQDKHGLRIALTTRHQIGIAQGLLMAHYDIDEDAAFEVLRRISSHHNVKLRDVAAAVQDHRGRMRELAWLTSRDEGPAPRPEPRRAS